MRIRTPSFFARFSCLGSHCHDNCCLGWEIDIDPDTAAFYRQVPGPFGDRLRRCIGEENGLFFFLLDEEERCPFLDRKNLCEIYQVLGKEHLCQICRDHPRFCGIFGPVCETGPGLCCEAAGRLLLENEDPLTLLEEETDDSGRGVSPGEELSPAEEQRRLLLEKWRPTAFSILQDRSQPLPQRIATLLQKGLSWQEELDGEPVSLPDQPPEPGAFVPGLLTLLGCCESLGPAWDRALKALQAGWREGKLQAALPDFRRALPSMAGYEKLLCYSLFRFWFRPVFDCDLLSVLQQSLLCIQTVFLLDLCRFAGSGRCTLSDRIDTAKLWSKEMEYSDENLSLLQENFLSNPILSVPAQLTFLPFL